MKRFQLMASLFIAFLLLTPIASVSAQEPETDEGLQLLLNVVTIRLRTDLLLKQEHFKRYQKELRELKWDGQNCAMPEKFFWGCENLKTFADIYVDLDEDMVRYQQYKMSKRLQGTRFENSTEKLTKEEFMYELRHNRGFFEERRAYVQQMLADGVKEIPKEIEKIDVIIREGENG